MKRMRRKGIMERRRIENSSRNHESSPRHTLQEISSFNALV